MRDGQPFCLDSGATREDVLSQRAHQIAPPQADVASKVGARLAVPRRMIVGQAAPAAVLDAHQRAVPRALEADLDQRLLMPREVHVAPLEGETFGRSPFYDGAHDEGAGPGAELDLFEQPATEARFKRELAGARAGDTKLSAVPPPGVDFGREDLEGVRRRHRHVD